MSNPCANLLVGTKPTRGVGKSDSDDAMKVEQMARALRTALNKPEPTNGTESATARAMRVLEARAKPTTAPTNGPTDVDSVAARIARLRMLATSAPVEEVPEHVIAARNTLNFLEKAINATNGMKDDEPTGAPEDDEDFVAKPAPRECLNKLGAIEDFKRLHASGGVMAYHVGDGNFRIPGPRTGKIREVSLDYMQHMVKCATNGCYPNDKFKPCEYCADKF